MGFGLPCVPGKKKYHSQRHSHSNIETDRTYRWLPLTLSSTANPLKVQARALGNENQLCEILMKCSKHFF
jgi:hypothetical protein